MFNSLKSKITVPIALVIVLLIAVIVVYVSISTANLVNSFQGDRLTAATQTVQAYLASHEQKTFAVASAMGGSGELARLIRAGDREAIWQYAFNRKVHFGVEEIIISSADAITLARSHMHDSYGDDISGVPSVAASLRREFVTLYTPTPTARMVMTSTAPIMDGDEFLGGVVVNYVIGRDDFLDRMAETFDIDVTVFNRDGLSVASTLVHPDTGDRATETTARADIIETVIERGEHMTLELNVFGFLPFYAYYFPLPGIDGNPNAMFFVGISREYGIATTNSQIRFMIIIGVIIALTTVLTMVYMITRSLKPLTVLQSSIDEVTDGKININMDKTKLSNDELGRLTLNVYGLVDVIKRMVQDLSNVQHGYHELGDMNYRIDTSDYRNAFKDMLETVNDLISAESENMVLITDMLNQIKDGDFDTSFKKMPGDKIILTETFNAVTANLKSVSAEVGAMIEAAAVKGDLHFQTAADKYKGDWREIMKGLNKIAEAVNRPIVEIREAMAALNQGNFTRFVNGDFAGDFLLIQNDINGVIKGMSSYINEIGDCLSDVANGDLTRYINVRFFGDFNKIKEAVRLIVDTLNRTMSEINSASAQVLMGAKQISDSAMHLATGTQEQASSVQELNASIELINTQTQQNADNALEANALSNKSTKNAKEGNMAMRQMLEAMSQIKESSRDISKIIKVIQDIAFQTNLLSLNAAVEAARAGEHGKGFSVVAEEVRNLAGRSETAAVETTVLIEDSINRVEAGSDIAGSTSQSFDIIVQNAGEVLDIIDKISIASREQAEGIDQISQGITRISEIVQSNSAVSEETAAASQELNSQAELLQQLVSYFKLQEQD